MRGAPDQDRGADAQENHQETAGQEQETKSQGQSLTVARRIVRIHDGRAAECEDILAVERTVTVVAGGEPFLRLQCLPEKVEELALGLLLSSGLLPPSAPPPPVGFDEASGEVRVDFSPDPDAVTALRQAMTLGSGCGAALSAAGPFDPLACSRRIDTGFAIEPSVVIEAMSAFVRRSELFKATGGVHAAAIASGSDIVAFAEDVGRHNAFDKVIGACYRQGIELMDKIALATGRLSVELVAKAIPVSLPLVASRSAPTSAAADLADEANLTLVGFVRAGRMNVYTHPWRIR